MEKIDISVEVRNETGKGNARRLREEQKVPGIFYGPHLKEPIAFSVKENEMLKILQKGGNIFLNLKGAATLEGKVAVVKDEQFHPVSGGLTHVDLYEVRMDEEIKVNVPVVLTGKAKGVAEGGILQQISREIAVRCLPGNIPEKISVDVSGLDVGFSIHVKELQFPEGVKMIGNVNFTIAAVVAPQEEEVAAPVAAAPGTAAAPGAAPVAGATPAPGAAPAAGVKPAPGQAPAAGAKPAPGAAGGKPAAGAAPAAGGKAPAKDSGKK